MNKTWHEKNKMPKNPTLEQRIAWHKKHRRACACREIAKCLLKYLEENPK